MAGPSTRATPRSAAAAARKGKGAAPRRTAKPLLLGRVLAQPGVIVAGVAFAAVMTGIVANALLFQTKHHASPMFGAPALSVGFEPSRLTAPSLPPVVPARIALAPDPMVTAPTPAVEAPAPVAAAVPAHVAAKQVKHPTTPPMHKVAHTSPRKDTLGDLIAKTQVQ